MTDLISRAMFNNEILVERKLKSCYINCEEEKDMNNFDILQEYEKAGVPFPRLEEWQRIKEEKESLVNLLEQLSNSFKVLEEVYPQTSLFVYDKIKRIKNALNGDKEELK